MCLAKIKDSIKISMLILNKALKQIPTDKRNMILGRFNTLFTKNKQLLNKNNADLQQLTKFKKDLEFNLNFIKLSHPNLDYTFEQPKPQENQKKSNGEGKQKKQEQQTHAFKVTGVDGLEIQRLPTEDIFDKQLQREKSVREEVQFSNWFDGNADPEQLKRHKQLLERQHFQGDYWKEKQKPGGFAKQYLQSIIAQKQSNGPVKPMQKKQQFYDYKPEGIDQSQTAWQKIKR